MTPEIERLAREAGLLPDNSHPAPETRHMRNKRDAVQRFAALIAEECAKECDTLADGPEVTPSQQFALDLAADAIRAKFAPSDGEDAAK